MNAPTPGAGSTTETDEPGRTRQTEVYRAGVFGRTPTIPADFAALERKARRHCSKVGWAYAAGGAGEGATMRANRQAFDKWAIVPRVLRDVSHRDLTTTLFGRRLPVPILLAPVGASELVHPGADVAIGQAAAELGIPYIVSNQGCAAMEDTAQAMDEVRPGAPRWFQLYYSTDDALVRSLVTRAEKMGAEAITVTLDTTMLGWRPQDLNLGYNPFVRLLGLEQYTSDPRFRQIVRERVAAGAARGSGTAPPRLAIETVKTLLTMAKHFPGTFLGNLVSPEPRAAVETFLEMYSRPTLDWEDILRLREYTDLPLLLKGVQHPEDARAALDRGIDGIIVSNHGGRQVDGGISSLEALVDIVPVVNGEIPVILDSGIRTGADVFKALALGADAVTLGRPHLYGLAIAGRRGARDATRNVIAEFDLTMALSGHTAVDQLTSDAVKKVG